MTRILGLSGSLRKGLFSTALLRAAAALMPAGASLDVVTLLRCTTAMPSAGRHPRCGDGAEAAIVDSDAPLIATPEYNNACQAC